MPNDYPAPSTQSHKTITHNSTYTHPSPLHLISYIRITTVHSSMSLSSTSPPAPQVLEITIRGKVQGVFFRKHTQATASGLGLLGTVQNQPDGSVYAVAVGSTTQLDTFEKWCREVGSPKSRIDSVNAIRHASLADFGFVPKPMWTNFSILR